MIHTRHALPVVLSALASATAQPPLETTLSTTNTVVNARNVKVAAPTETLPRTATLQATAKLAYVLWQEGATAPSTVLLARTSDGGTTWTKTPIYSTVAGETLTGLELAASGHAVFVAFLSNKKNTAATRNDVYVMASSDEGATFSAPTLVNTITTAASRGDAQILSVAAGLYLGNPRCYLAYEHSPATSKEDPYFTAVEVSGASIVPVVADVLLNKSVAAGTNDIDDVAIAADGGTVCVAWRDERGNPAGNNDMYAIVSKLGGSDFTSPSVAEKRISTNAGLGGVEVPVVAVGGGNCYVLWLDNRNDLVTSNDEAFLAYSNDSGGTWTEVNLVTALPHPVDIDGPAIAAEGNTVVIAFEDDTRARTLSPAPTDPNKADSTHVIVSKNGGGTRTSTYVSTAPSNSNWIRCEQPKVAIHDDFVHVCWEESWLNTNSVSSDEDIFMAKSFDGGLTFTAPVPATARGSAARNQSTGGGDIDNPFLEITGNGEGVVGFLNENPSAADANFANVLVRGGLEVSSKFLGGAGAEIRHAPMSQAGGLALLLLTQRPGATPLWLPSVFGNLGFEPLLEIDAVTSLGLQLLPVVSGTIPAAGGTVALPLVPNLNGALWVVGVTVDLGTFQWRSFSPRGRV